MQVVYPVACILPTVGDHRLCTQKRNHCALSMMLTQELPSLLDSASARACVPLPLSHRPTRMYVTCVARVRTYLLLSPAVGGVLEGEALGDGGGGMGPAFPPAALCTTSVTTRYASAASTLYSSCRAGPPTDSAPEARADKPLATAVKMLSD